MPENSQRNLREYHSKTKYRLVIWFVILLFTFGLGLIWFFYGAQSALLGFFCLLGAGIPIGLIALVILAIDKLAKRD